VFVLSTNRKGAIAETAIAAAATKLGIPVLRPIVEHARYDLAFEIGDRILRVQCKWGGLHQDGAIIRVNLTSSWCTPTGYERRYYSEDEVDLRVTPPKNGQRACLNRAVDFALPGAVAQLEEHLPGRQGARGSSPLSSTPSTPETLHVGCHEFRNHFGYYLERAADGHEILVSRRGRPYARMIPVAPRLLAAA
jgi:prevent-host-death family protein